MNSNPDKKRSWRDLPKLSFSRVRRADGGETTANVVHEVGSAERLGAEFDNRKLALGVKTKR